jgi:hypothetical protein
LFALDQQLDTDFITLRELGGGHARGDLASLRDALIFVGVDRWCRLRSATG